VPSCTTSLQFQHPLLLRQRAVARGLSDHRSLQFLQWFIEEQVEEERTMRDLLDLIDSGINLFAAEQMLDGPA
jgi:ferritin